MKYIFLLLLTTGSLGYLSGQTVSEALRYSTMNFGTTGRAIGAGSAFGALGADASLIGANPAGLAAFRRSEITITPGLFIENTSSRLTTAEAGAFEESKTNFNLSNFNLILHGSPRAAHWKTANFSLGLNRIANYNQEFHFEGTTAGTITDRWLELANGNTPNQLDPFEAGPAYDAGALIPTNTETEYLTDFSFYPDVEVEKAQDVITSGSMNEFSLSFAGNYEDKIYGGVSLGVPFLTYDEEKIYTQRDENDDIPAFNKLTYTERLQTTGTGINLKLGLIYRLNQMIRLGFAAHTPTLMGMEDNFSTTVIYNYTSGQNDGPVEANSPDGNFEYKLVTPWRLMGSAGVIIGKNGFVSAEVEWLDHSTSSFDFDSSNPDDRDFERSLNRDISHRFESVVNFRLGGEWAINIFRLRAGYGLNGNPFIEGGESTNNYSFGVGLREKKFFLDFGFRRSAFQEGYYPYQTLNTVSPFVENEVTANNYILTFGFKL